MHLTFDDSVAEGVENIRTEMIKPEYYANDGKVIVFGYSQSAVIIAIEKQNLVNDPLAPDPEDLQFVVVGSLSNPDGGLFTRLPGLRHPRPWRDVRAADAERRLPDHELRPRVRGPRRPARQSAEPAGTGERTRRRGTTSPGLPQRRPRRSLANIELPTTNPKSVYVLVPTPRLPILMVLDGVVPEPILAGLDPVLRWGVDLGYDRTTPANVPTPFTLLPTFNPVTAASELPKAIADGIDAAASSGQRSACGSCAIEIEAAAIEFHAGATDREACRANPAAAVADTARVAEVRSGEAAVDDPLERRVDR